MALALHGLSYLQIRRASGFWSCSKHVAFRRRVMYGLGLSLSRGTYRPTFNIHLKTSRCAGIEGHGYPDAGYFKRALDELKVNGVTLAELA